MCSRHDVNLRSDATNCQHLQVSFVVLPSIRTSPGTSLRSFAVYQPVHPIRRRLRFTARKDPTPNRTAVRKQREPSVSLKRTPNQIWSAGERPPVNGIFPPGNLPFSVELDFVLNHPITDTIIAFLLALNCLAFALQTIDVGPELHRAFESYESNLSIVFLIEYFGRWYGKGLSPRFLLTRDMLLDFVAVSPIGFAFVDQSEALFVRILRLTRIFRIQRVFLDPANSIMDGMSGAQLRLASIGLSLFSLLYVSAGLFYQVEKDVNPAVLNFFDAFYFSTVTLFTVGFGDVTPLTPMGKTITVMTVLTGAVIIPFKLSAIETITKTKRRLSEASAPSPCNQCFLIGHQIDARFCRNCGALLRKKRFD
ncbi:unnamed protein product [Chondrus crispus]|uniref:Ion transport domain-containing protein n=1 Tax=Chondrus crispus TaxID=2769 RepID=R7QSY6_CHOCR|nr:unnamed protein product [Chondrus crispus]CDF40626.1 unnamed protein product [Chondrus crispus]|eukprot:XP_005710920.1 unnamed protein product [Chondrus crispus]